MDLRKDIYFYADLASFPASGAANLLYVDSATSLIYIWNGASYVASGAGGLKYAGLWDANANSPVITSGVGDTGEYYIVGTAGTTSIDGISDWGVGDWIIFGGFAWQKIDNSDKEGYTTVEDEGTPLTQRSTINFVGSGVSAADSGGKTVVTISAGSSSGKFGVPDANGAYTYYATLALALAAASAGDTIEMFTDVTDSTSTPVELKPNVNINGNGHTYNHTSNSGATFTITDTAGTKNGDINLYNFNIKRTTTASSGNPIFTASSSYTYIYNTFNFYGCKVSYTSTSGATPCFDGGNLSQAIINGLDFTSNGSGNAISTAFVVDVNNSVINCTGTSSGINTTGTIKNCIINVTSGVGINTSTPYECTVFASTSGTCFRTPVAYNCTAFSNTGYCFDGSYLGANTVYNCIARTTSGVGYWSSNCISSSAFATTGKTIDLHFNYGADAYKFYNNFFYASTAPAVDISSVTIMDSSIFCGWNSASGHGIRMSGTTGVISNNIIDVSNTSANCINSAAASTLKYSINTFKGATTSVNANVTQGMVNNQDTKGNIVI